MSSTELELKFCLDAAAAERWREHLQRQGAQRERLRARYLDTDDGRLAAARIALRLRHEGRCWVQTLKAEGPSLVQRLEHEVVVSAAEAAAPTPDLNRHAGHPAGELLAQALAGLPAEALHERYATDVWRTKLRLRTADGTEVEAALDIGEVRAAGRVSPLAELELEHLDGSVQGLFDLAHDAVAEGGLWLSTISKAERGELLRADSPPRAVKAQPLPTTHKPDGPTLWAAVLHNALAQVLPNASAVAEGHEDAELVHQLRVGLRRLRTALRELGPLLMPVPPEWEAALGRAFTVLGERRDNESVAAAVRPLLEAAAAPSTAWTMPAVALPREALREPGLQQVLVALLARLHAVPDRPFRHRQLRQAVGERLQRLHHQVLRDGRHFDQLATDRQHRVRKRLKRLRYLAEFVRPLWPGKAVDRYIEALKPAQQALGEHNDGVVAAEAFRREAEADPRAWFAAGWLQARQADTARTARQALRAVADDAEPFWED